MKRGSRTLILIQVFVLSAIVGTLSPTVSAAYSGAETKTSQPDFQEFSPEENIGFDWFNRTVDFKPDFVPGEVLVKFRTSISFNLVNGGWTTGIKLIDKVIEQFKVKWITRIFSRAYKLTLPKDLDVLYVAKKFETVKYFVEYAEPNGIYRTSLVPNDANYTQQWAHQMIKSEFAWNVTRGDPNVVIAIVDSGVDYNHPDLAANIWINTDEIPNNGIDDDLNGFIDDVRGWDFVEAPTTVSPGEDGTQPDNDPMDFLGHGTFVAGIVGAVTNNTIGIAGVTWNSKIMAVRSGYSTPAGGILTYDQVAAGIRYAADNDADIISMSFASPLRSKVVYNAIKDAYDRGVLLVGAAGNDAERTKTYPAAHEEVVAVTATDQTDSPAYFTNFGNWVEVAAPGVDILSTTSPNASKGPYELQYPYDYASGTSAATPYVAGVAAIIWSQFPNMTRDQVRVQLRRTAVDLPPEGFDNYYGYGRINAHEAVKQVPADYDILVLNWKLPFVSAGGEDTVASYPSGGNLLGSTQYVSGSLTDLQSSNGVHMTFRSYTTATALKTLYAHQETTTIGGATYYLQKSESADASGTSLSVSIATTGRKLWGKFVYQLGGVSSIPSSTWTIYYRTWFSAGGTAHADVDILIRQSDGTVRTTIATNVADSLGLTSTPQTLSGTYNFPGYAVVEQTDYLEIDYYVEVTTKKSGASAYLRIDDNALPLADQTRASIYLPSEFAVEIEFTGSSNTEDWTQLVWTVDSSFTTENVTATFQLFNYTANAYQTSGDGYMTDTIGTSDVTKTQTITPSSKHFRDATGNWKIKVKGVKSTSSQFDWRGDLIEYKVTWPLYSVKTTILNFGAKTVTGINVKLLVNGTEKDSEQISELPRGESIKVICSWTPQSEGIYNVTTYVVPNNELSNVTQNNAQSAYSWIRYNETVKVPEDFPAIQEAIEIANLGIYIGEATIRVSNGTYYEYDLLIQTMLTSLTLVGENSLTTSISGAPGFIGVFANSDNVTIKGLTIQNSYIGVELWGDNCIVRSSSLTGNTYGIMVAYYSNNTVRDNIVSQNSGPGIRLAYTSGNTIINNSASSNQYGLYMGDAANKTLVSSNTITNNYYGIWVLTASDNILTNNTLTGNTYSFGIYGNILSQFIHNIDTTNKVNGKPIYYLINQSNLVIEPSNFPSVGYLGLVNSTGITVRDLNVSQSIQAIMFAYSKDSNIRNVNASDNTYGICFYNSNNTLILNNTLTNSYFGVYTWTSTNNTITQNILSNDNYGFYLSRSSGNNISGNTIINTIDKGINLYSSNDNTLESNTVTNSKYDIYLLSSKGNNLRGNTVKNSTYGIYVYNSESSVLTNNSMTDNKYNFFVEGVTLAQYIHSVDTSNRVNGKPMYYLINKANLVVGPSTFPNIGFLGLVNSTKITVENVTLGTYNGQGILFAYVTDSAIRNVSASTNFDGVYLLNSNKTSVSGSALLKNVYGVRIRNSQNNTLDGNVITEMDREGIYLLSSTHIIISGNTVSNCSRAGSYNGIYLSSSGSNTIIRNRISYNKYGVRTVTSSSNVIYHNNLVKNTYQVYTSGSTNSWDNGAQGNYWSDYTGKDLNGDGVGDTPYTKWGITDRYPLINPWGTTYALNLRVMDWDLTDSIQGAYVYVDSNVKISDVNGWANWTVISGTVYVKVKWHGGWVNGTFSVAVFSNKTVSIQGKIFDITVTTREGGQGAVLQYVNVTVYNATGGLIRTGVTDSNGKVYLTNVPNSTLTFTAYEGSSSQHVIANVTRTITVENQAETVICDQNYVSTSQEWSIIADYNTFSLILVPFSLNWVTLPVFYPEESFSILRCLRISIGLKERVKKIRSKPKNEKGERKKHESFG